MRLVIADDYERLRAAAGRVFATHQRCRIHWARNSLAHTPPGNAAVAAMLTTIFEQDTEAEAEA